MKENTLHDKLVDIQQRLKVPKDIDNDFGGFKYRNLEDIEDKIKPLLKEHDLHMIFEDLPVEVGGRVYIKSTVYLSDGKNTISTSAYARESVAPKSKMDDSQLTGSCSSYARKYAAGGLFLIDNTKDADSFSGKEEPTKPYWKKLKESEDNLIDMANYDDGSENTVTDEQINEIKVLATMKGTPENLIKARLRQIKTKEQADEALSKLRV